MRIVFYCPDFYCPTEIKEIKEIFVPTREAFLLFLLFLRDLKHACWLDLFYYPKEIKEIFIPPSAKPFLSFLLFLWDNYYLMRIVFISHRYKRSKGKRYFTALFMGGVRTIQVLRPGGFMDANMNGLLV